MKSSKGHGICRLCSTEQPLCNSHIIPEFFYKPLYDSNHKFQRLSTDGSPHRLFEQKGVREYLLCSECEGRFGKFERYASRILFGAEEIDIICTEPDGFACRVDYRKFKLFQLSLLWRVGVSSLPEFVEVELGEHEAILREMLLAEEPGGTEEYGCIIIRPISHRDLVDQLIMSAGIGNLGSAIASKLVLGGMCWYQFLACSAVDSRQADLFLQDDGELRILTTDIIERHFIERLAGELYHSSLERFQDK